MPCDLVDVNSSSLKHYDVMFIVNKTLYIVKFKLITDALSTPALAAIATETIILQSVENREYEERAFVKSHWHTAGGGGEGVKDVIYIGLVASTVDKRSITMAMQSTKSPDKTVQIVHFKQPVE